MENMMGYDQIQKGLMIKELIVGIEAAKQLRRQILSPTSNGSFIVRDDGDQVLLNHSLIDKMLSSFDKTIAMAKYIPSLDHNPTTTSTNNNFQSESPPSLPLSSPAGSENSNHDLHASKKRKTMPRWTKRVQFCAGGSVSVLEGPLGDGFSWRKYGQKDILGAKFPRGYYRCSHRHSKGCAATKQVQRSNDDPSIYLIIYRGEHTCTHRPYLAQAQIKTNAVQIKTEPHPQILPTPQEKYQNAESQSPPQQEMFLGLGLDGDLKFEHADNILRSFSFTGLLETRPIDSHILGCSPAFGSPRTLDSNYNGLESDLNEAISGPNSVINSPIIDEFEFPLDQLLDIDANFPFEF